MAHYVVGDIHNDCKRLQELLERIHFSEEDHLIVLGDLFDRNEYAPNPVGVYFKILELGSRCSVVRGNHDTYLAQYIIDYYKTPERKRKRLQPYQYNSFELVLKRLSDWDVQNLATTIMSWPLQIQIEIEETKYLFAHAMTSLPEKQENEDYYISGDSTYGFFLKEGVEGYISVCAHSSKGNSVWKNSRENVYLCDCGCGYQDGRLGCLCLETKEEFYV